MNKTLQAKHVPDELFLSVVDNVRREHGRWTFVGDIEDALGLPAKIVRAKAAALIRRKIITGCVCGCRGDFERTKPAHIVDGVK